MEVHGENPFKARSYGNAAFQIGKYPKPLRELDPSAYSGIPGLGKNLVPKLEELIETGEMAYLTNWLEQTPEGVISLLKIKGVGPGKVRTIWKDMGIETPGELLYACNENRLVDYKGFGAKTQEQVRQSIEFMMEHEHSFLYATVEALLTELITWVKERNGNAKIEAVGEAGRKSLTMSKLEFVVADAPELPDTSESKVAVEFHEVPAEQFELEVFQRTATPEHLQHITIKGEATAQAIYQVNGLPLIPAEMREGHREFDWAKSHTESDLVTDADLKGCLHNHSTYSDGIHALEDMAVYLKEQGYEYFGICDHSQTAVYANGLKEDRVRQQQEEIDALNEKLNPFRILKGIESDILVDGSLDYPEDVLKTFDFIVASVHSVLKMDVNTATARLIKAVENPYTSILGHPTGRLLLSRPGYPIDHKKVIDACAANGVAVELNANPMRLDVDWTWVPYCMEKGVMVSINPDAHRKEGFHHMRYGVIAARKGGLVTEQCLNACSMDQIVKWFSK